MFFHRCSSICRLVYILGLSYSSFPSAVVESTTGLILDFSGSRPYEFPGYPLLRLAPPLDKFLVRSVYFGIDVGLVFTPPVTAHHFYIDALSVVPLVDLSAFHLQREDG